MEAPIINVGILTRQAITFRFNGTYILTVNGSYLTGEQRAFWNRGRITFKGKSYQDLFFEPISKENSFELQNVTIGVDFHWQREEDQCFHGALSLLSGPEGILVINQIDVERYLTCVIASEMNAQAPKEFLKAHAVISRSWLLAQIEKKHFRKEPHPNSYQDNNRLIRWYDREDHHLFDVCADDHCQRYQGTTRSEENPVIQSVMQETCGEVLMCDNQICDTRFSKCCGGVTEAFEHCWENIPHPYLKSIGDNPSGKRPDLSIEAEAEKWIRSSPTAFCHTEDKTLLASVLNNYDQETSDFYRWTIRYTQKELSGLIRRKTDMDFGEILDLVPLKRGESGRIGELQIVGSKRIYIIGKELEIRRALSESHLYSSAFVVDKEQEKGNPIPTAFVLHGAGWGHGVGLCQIGAAVMSTQGYDYRQILSHYFPNTTLEKHY